MARDKIGARKSAAVNPDIGGTPGNGDERSLGSFIALPIEKSAGPVFDAPPDPGTLSIDDLTDLEANGGQTSFFFTVHRTGGSDGIVSATWTLTLSGTADSGDFNPSAQTGTVTFADGAKFEFLGLVTQYQWQGQLDNVVSATFNVRVTGAVKMTDAPANGG